MVSPMTGTTAAEFQRASTRLDGSFSTISMDDEPVGSATCRLLRACLSW
jgi:hypothetical protein